MRRPCLVKAIPVEQGLLGRFWQIKDGERISNFPPLEPPRERIQANLYATTSRRGFVIADTSDEMFLMA